MHQLSSLLHLGKSNRGAWEGGSTAWNTTTASTLTVHLGMREDGSPSWQLTLVKDKDNVLEYWEICADTGVLLEHSSTGGL